MADIFISHSTADHERLTPLLDLLERQGWTTWWSPQLRRGSPFDDEIKAQLGAAKCVLVVWSRDSVRSDYVKSEAEKGRTRGILIPVFLDEVDVPMPYERLQGSRLFEPDGTLREAEATDLLAAIGERLEKPPTALPERNRKDLRRIALLGATTHEIERSKEKTRAIMRFYRALLAAVERTPYGLTSCGAEPLRRAFFESYCEKLYSRPRGDMKEIDRRVRWYWFPGDTLGFTHTPAFYENRRALDTDDRNRQELADASLMVAFTGRTGTRSQIEGLLADHKRGRVDLRQKKLILLGWFGGSIKSVIDERRAEIQWLLDLYPTLVPDQYDPAWHEGDRPERLAETLVNTLGELLRETAEG